MKIHGMCLVKNESDIITQTLEAATKWCDYIYVYDNGSTDGTWEQALKLAEKYEQIITYKKENCNFNDDLRRKIFNEFRGNSSEGDWWCRLDADEIYIDDPRVFLAKVPKEYAVVVSASFEYYFTDKDLDLYNENPDLYANDVPVSQKCRYYINNWTELRFIRYRKDLVWGEKDGGWPSAIWNAPIYPVRIWLKHYQYRSPQQIQKRLDTRRPAILNNSSFCHEAQRNWQELVSDQANLVADFSKIDIQDIPDSWMERVVDASRLNYDAHDRRFVLREDLMPTIKNSKPKSSINIIKSYFNKYSKIFSLHKD